MPGPRLPHVIGTGGAVFGLGRDGLEDRGHARPVFGRAARHDRRAVPGTLLAAGNADAHEAEREALRGAAVGIVEIGVARVDHEVVGREQRREGCQHVVHRRACGNHQDDRARRRDGGDEIGEGVGGRDAGGEIPCPGLEGPGHAGGAVPDGDREALLGDIERQRRAHGAKADQAGLRFGHGPRSLHGICTPLRLRITE